MIQLKRNNISRFNSEGVFGKLILKSSKADGQELILFTREKIWNETTKWPFGKPMDSCIPSGEYIFVRSYAALYNNDEVFLYNPKHGVYVANQDRSSATDRYGCIFTYQDIDTIGEGCIEVGMGIITKNGKTSLAERTKAYRILRSWLDNNLDQGTITISWGLDTIV